MVKNLLIESYSAEDFFEELAKFLDKREKMKSSLQNCDDVLMTTKQCCEFLQISRGKLWKLTSNGIIPSIFCGNSRRFQKKEVLKALSINI